MIEVRCFGSLAELAHLRNEMNALNLASARPDPFSTFEFFENFLRHDECFPAGAGMRLWFLAAFLNNRLVGYLALKQTPHTVLGMQTPVLGFLVTHDTDRPHMVASPEYQGQISAAFYNYLLGRKQEWSFLEFHQQDDSSALFPPPATVDLKRYWVQQWPSLENGTIHVVWGTLREYFNALSHKSRSNVSRQMRSLFAAGEVELLASSDPASTPLLFELYRSIEASSWKLQGKAGIGRHPERIEYLKGLLDAKQPMRMSIQVLLLDGAPIAGLIMGAYNRGLYALHSVYDDRQNHLAPGSALLLMGVRMAIIGQYAFLNLLSGFGYYKTRWLAQITEARIAQIYRVGGLMYWHRRLGDWQRRLFSAKSKASPALFNPLRRDVSAHKADKTAPDALDATPARTEERQRIATLIAKARNSQGEHLSASALAALLPFETQRATGAGNRHAA